MYKKVIVFYVLLLWIMYYPITARAGMEDSLLTEIKKAGNNTEQVTSIYTMLAYSQLTYDIDKSINYARTGINLSKKYGHKKQEIQCYITLINATNSSGKPDEALLIADTTLQLAYKLGNYRLAFHAEITYSAVYRRKANAEASLKHAMAAVKLAEKNHDEALTSSAMSTLAAIYSMLHDLDRADEYNLKALAIDRKLGDSIGAAVHLDNLGINNRERELYDKALYYYWQSLKIAVAADDSEQISNVLNDIGAAYSKKGDVHNGEKYLKQSIGIRERMNALIDMAYTLNYLGENYEKKKDLVNAELYIKKALAMARQIGNTRQTYQALGSLSEFYSRNKKFDSAYVYLSAYHGFSDSITNNNNQKVIAELTTKYETETKEHKIKEQEYALVQRNYMLIGIIILVMVLIIVAILIYNRYRLRQRTKLQKAIIHQQELATKAVIEAEEKERKRIAGDLHDGVGQLMSAARMNLSVMSHELHFPSNEQKIAFDKALALVDESCKEVRTVSHNIMPNALLKSGLASAIREFIDKIDARILKVNLFTEGINERLPSNIETVLYRIIQECINNVIKHSGANHLDISIIKDHDGISVTIEDNGKGFNVSDKTKFEGIGLKNIQTRVRYLKGSVEWDSATGKGTVVSIHIP